MKAVEQGHGTEVTVERSAQARLLVAETSYKTADLGLREAFVKFARANGVVEALPGVQESAVLSTCNRFEVYFATTSPEATYSSFLAAVRRGAGVDPEPAFSPLTGIAAVRHLFRVAAGLESVAIGEPQILAQVRGAGIQAREAGDAGRILSPLFDRATRIGSMVRTTVGLGSDEVSLSDLAMDAVAGMLPEERDVLLVGSGKMVQLAARRLVGRSTKLYVVSKRRLPSGLKGSIRVRRADIQKTASRCDLLIAATSVERPIVTKDDLRGRRKVVVDLGMPRNVSPSARELPNVRLIDLDDLARMTPKKRRTRELREAEEMVDREAADFYEWLVQTKLSSALADIYGWANEVREEELTRALGKLQPKGPREARILEVMGRRLVSKLMARPAKFAHARHVGLAEEEKLQLLRSVFGVGHAEIGDRDDRRAEEDEL